jgi:hypothetical protein
MTHIMVLSIVHENVFRILAFSVHRVIFSKKFMFFMRIYKGDYGVWNPYLASAQRLHPKRVRTTMFSQLLDISKALYHDVRHAE